MRYVLKKPVLTISVVVCIVAAFLFLAINRTPEGDLTVEQKVADFEYLYVTMEANYPLFDVVKRQTGLDWLSKHDEYLARVKRTRNDVQYVNALAKILSELRQGHTDLVSGQFYDYMLEMFLALKEEQPVQPWLDVLTAPRVMERYQWWRDLPQSSRSSGSPSLPSGLETEVIEPGQIGYMAVKSFGHQNIEADRPKLDQFVQSINDFPYLIIDIRGNSGGSDLYWLDGILRRLITEPLHLTRYSVLKAGDVTRRFLPEAAWKPIDVVPSSVTSPELLTSFSHCIRRDITVSPLDPVGFSGKVFLLVDKRVFSSSENLAFYSKSTGWATLVGTSTSGDGGGSTPALFSLPESGLVVRFRVEMGINPDGSSNVEYGTKPDIEIGAGEDALQVALKMIREAVTP